MVTHSPPPKQPPVKLKVNPDELPQVFCQHCMNGVFSRGFIRKRVSGFQSPNGQPCFFDIPVVFCLRCFHLLDEKTALEMNPARFD